LYTLVAIPVWNKANNTSNATFLISKYTGLSTPSGRRQHFIIKKPQAKDIDGKLVISRNTQ